MSKKMSSSRAQKRAYEKYLKKTNPSKYKEWKSNMIDRLLEDKHNKTIDKNEEIAQKMFDI